MPESIPKILPDASESLSFFQSEAESPDVELDTDEIALGEIPLAPPALLPHPRLDSDNDCACE